MAEDRVQVTVRLDRADKAFFAEMTEASGFEHSVAVRAIVELMIQRMRRGGDFLDALHELKTLWRAPYANGTSTARDEQESTGDE